MPEIKIERRKYKWEEVFAMVRTSFLIGFVDGQEYGKNSPNAKDDEVKNEAVSRLDYFANL